MTVGKDASAAPLAEWVYAVAAPFPTSTDEISWADVQAGWSGAASGPFGGQALLMTDDTVKALAAEKQFFKEGINKIINTKRAEFEGGQLSFNIGLLSTLFNQANMIAILGYSAMLTLQGKLTTGELVAFNAMIGLLFTPLMGLIGVWDEIQQIHICKVVHYIFQNLRQLGLVHSKLLQLVLILCTEVFRRLIHNHFSFLHDLFLFLDKIIH